MRLAIVCACVRVRLQALTSSHLAESAPSAGEGSAENMGAMSAAVGQLARIQQEQLQKAIRMRVSVALVVSNLAPTRARRRSSVSACKSGLSSRVWSGSLPMACQQKRR